jgi:adenosylcobinamide-phosphate synthase
MGIEGLAPSAPLLLTGLLLDVVFGDPQVRLHPIRLLGDTLSFFEKLLRRAGLDGRGGGCVLFVLLVLVWVGVPSFAIYAAGLWNTTASLVLHILIVYVLFSLRDLVDHVRRVQKAANLGDLRATHKAIALFVGREVDRMDFAACRRAAIESLAESFVDGFLSAVFWYVLLGVPGLLLFKVVSTMDSMVGFKTPRYLYFGWCGARIDDLMNYVPARLGWLLLALSAIPFRGLSSAKGLRFGLRQHAIVPGPNAGWSEATMAGVLQRRLIGPIWKNGALVTDVWLGEPSDPPAGSDTDVFRALAVTILGAVVTTLFAVVTLNALAG